MLLPYEERLKDDMSYFRKLGVKYEADALIDLLKREKPKSAMPVACHSLADLNAKHAIPVLKTLAEYPVQDVKATSVLAVARLAGSDETPWLVECLSRKRTNRDSLGNVVFAVAYLEQMTEAHPEVIGLLDRFKVVAPKLPGNVPSELGHFTRMFADWKNKHGPRESGT
jgi:hypothetical protein